jgi:RimJ/RimL family protein N-acetyltransferase
MPGLKPGPEVQLKGERITLRPVAPGDVTDDYVAWMNDPEVNQYMETRFSSHARDDVASFVERMRGNENVYFLAITLNEDGRHVGNIKLALRPQHETGEISLFIGDKSQWGRGLGSEAIALVRDFGLNELGLAKLTAGCYADNAGSARAFEKCGFRREAVLEAEHVSNGRRVDGYRYACFGGRVK